MTPLAQYIIKQSLLSNDKREFDDRSNMIPKMKDVHCFSLSSEVYRMSVDLCQELFTKETPVLPAFDPYLFLPFKKTWIEFPIVHEGHNRRCGFLFYENEPGVYHINMVFKSFSHIDLFVIDLRNNGDDKISFGVMTYGQEPEQPFIFDTVCLLLSFLYIINRNNIFYREIKQPHKGLAKKLRKLDRDFPLHAWSEITLKVNENYKEREQSAKWLNGKRAFHWVRAHWSTRYGKPVFIGSFTRGDPALGVRNSKYKIIG